MVPMHALLVLAPLALSACATVRHQSLAPVRPSRLVESRLEVRPVSASASPRLEGLFDAARTEDERIVTLRARLFAVDPALAREALGERGVSLVALVCAGAEGRRLAGDLQERLGETAHDLNDMRLSLHSGQEGYVSVLNQKAYVAAYTLVSTATAAIADPEVAVAQDGVVLEVLPRLDEAGEGLSLSLELSLCELEQPFAQRRLALGGAAAPMTVQVPAGLMRTLRCEVALRLDEALVVGGGSLPVSSDGRVLLVVLELERGAAEADL